MPENEIYREVLRDTIKELKEVIKDIQGELVTIHSSIAVLQYKSGVWGAIGAMATILALLLVEKLKK